MNSNVVFGQYYNASSWIHKLDPRTKIIAMIIYMVAIFLVSSVYYLLGFLVLTSIILLTSKIPITKFLKSIKMLTYLLFLTFLFQVIFRTKGTIIYTQDFNLTVVNLILIILIVFLYFYSSRFIKKFRFLLFLVVFFISMLLQVIIIKDILITTYKFNLYNESLIDALFLILRLVNIILVSSLLTLSTKPTELNYALEKLFKPLNIFNKNVAAILSMMIAIALRNIPTLINEASKILKAQASRGVDFKESTFKEKITQIISLIVPMFIISYKKAEDLSNAMEARGYNPTQKRTSINVLKFNLSDIVVFIVVGLILITIIVLKIVVGV